jgi:hypothetical protein
MKYPSLTIIMGVLIVGPLVMADSARLMDLNKYSCRIKTVSMSKPDPQVDFINQLAGTAQEAVAVVISNKMQYSGVGSGFSLIMNGSTASVLDISCSQVSQ